MNHGKLIDSDEDVKEKEIKILLVGNPGVGKTALIKRYIEESYPVHYTPTKGVEFYVKKTELNKKKIAMKLWDISGDSLTNKMIQTYLHNSKAILFVYDISNPDSLNDLREWVNTINQIISAKKIKDKPYYGLLANKLDLFHIKGSKLPTNDSFINENNMKSYMASAKTGDQVSYTFTKVACEVLNIPFKDEEQVDSKIFLKALLPQEEQKITFSKDSITPPIYPPKNTFQNNDSPSKSVTPKITSNISGTNPIINISNKAELQPQPNQNQKPNNKVEPPKTQDQKKSSACIIF